MMFLLTCFDHRRQPSEEAKHIAKIDRQCAELARDQADVAVSSDEKALARTE